MLQDIYLSCYIHYIKLSISLIIIQNEALKATQQDREFKINLK